MNKDRISENLARAVVAGDEEAARDSAQEVVERQIDPLEEEGLSQGMKVVGRQFESGEVFLPERLMAGEAFNVAMEILSSEIEAQKVALLEACTAQAGSRTRFIRCSLI